MPIFLSGNRPLDGAGVGGGGGTGLMDTVKIVSYISKSSVGVTVVNVCAVCLHD